MQPHLQGLGGPGDGRQGIVDFVGHARGQEPDAGQLLAADDLLGALPDLLVAFLDLQVQVVADLQEPLRHGVHGAGQFGDFVVRRQLDAVLEVAVASDAAAALDQRAQRLEDRASEEFREGRQDDCGRDAGDPRQQDIGAILTTDVAGQLAQPLVQVLRQGQRPRMQIGEGFVQVLDLDLIEDPIVVLIQLGHLFQAVADLGDRLTFRGRAFRSLFLVRRLGFVGPQRFVVTGQSLLDLQQLVRGIPPADPADWCAAARSRCGGGLGWRSNAARPRGTTGSWPVAARWPAGY